MSDPADDFAFRFVTTPSDGSAPEVLFSIKGDGTIERGPAFTTTDAMSLEFWDAIERMIVTNHGTVPFPQPSATVCCVCHQETKAHLYMCDKVAGFVWCPECFALTPCSEGAHGEGCATMIMGSTSGSAP